MLERRAYPRFRLSLPVRIFCQSEKLVFESTTEDISQGGVAFVLSKQLEPGTPILCELSMVLGTQETGGLVLLRGKVVRMEKTLGARVKIGARIDSYEFVRREGSASSDAPS